MSSKKPSVFRKVADYTVLAPINLVFNKGTKSHGRIYSEAASAPTKIYCPRCTQGVFFLKPPKKQEGEDDSSQNKEQSQKIPEYHVWECSYCALNIETQTKSQKELMSILKDNALHWYQEGAENGFDEFSDEQRSHGVRQFMKKALVFYVLALISLLFIPYFLMHSSFLPTVNMLLLLVFLGFSGLHNGFKAWKLHNDLLFQPNPKELFVKWLKKGQYLKPWDYKTSMTEVKDA